MGKSIKGEQETKSIPILQHTTLEGFAYESYDKVCGEGNEIGDGVVPCCAGHLDGATHVTIEGVQHSFTFPGDWYGSPNIINLWHHVMMDQIILRERSIVNDLH